MVVRHTDRIHRQSNKKTSRMNMILIHAQSVYYIIKQMITTHLKVKFKKDLCHLTQYT